MSDDKMVRDNELTEKGMVPHFKQRAIKVQPKPDRNKPCSCGSGKKYKNCCIRLTRLSTGIAIVKEILIDAKHNIQLDAELENETFFTESEWKKAIEVAVKNDLKPDDVFKFATNRDLLVLGKNKDGILFYGLKED